MNTFFFIFLVSVMLILIGGVAFIYIMSSIEEEKERKEYNKSLFKYLSNMNKKIYQFNKNSYLGLDGVLGEFYEISSKIKNLDGSYSFDEKLSLPEQVIKNMRLIDSLTYHEINALKKVNKSLNIGILLTDEKIQDALVEITKGLNKHYKEFCDLQNAEVVEETYILKMLDKKENERLEYETEK